MKNSNFHVRQIPSHAHTSVIWIWPTKYIILLYNVLFILEFIVGLLNLGGLLLHLKSVWIHSFYLWINRTFNKSHHGIETRPCSIFVCMLNYMAIIVLGKFSSLPLLTVRACLFKELSITFNLAGVLDMQDFYCLSLNFRFLSQAWLPVNSHQVLGVVGYKENEHQ